MFEVIFRRGGPVVDYDAADAAQREQSDLLRGLCVWSEMLRSDNLAVNQLFVSVHAIEYDH